jgi:hypothetical protein
MLADIVTLEEADRLPRCVRRYFEFAFASCRARARYARLTQRGEMRGDEHQHWSPFRATESLDLAPRSFAWSATMLLFGVVPISIRDEYRTGRGASQARLAGLVPLAAQAGTPEVASASLLRYLAEGAWLPTLLLPSPHLQWEDRGELRARATLTDRGTTVFADFAFTDSGAITTVTAVRYRDVHGIPILTPWVGRYRAYARVAGMMIPLAADVSWVLPGGEMNVWRGRIVRADYVW